MRLAVAVVFLSLALTAPQADAQQGSTVIRMVASDAWTDLGTGPLLIENLSGMTVRLIVATSPPALPDLGDVLPGHKRIVLGVDCANTYALAIFGSATVAEPATCPRRCAGKGLLVGHRL
jgi:hypothetical protein